MSPEYKLGDKVIVTDKRAMPPIGIKSYLKRFFALLSGNLYVDTTNLPRGMVVKVDGTKSLYSRFLHLVYGEGFPLEEYDIRLLDESVISQVDPAHICRDTV